MASAVTAKLSHFRDLLTQVEREYSLLLEDVSGEASAWNAKFCELTSENGDTAEENLPAGSVGVTIDSDEPAILKFRTQFESHSPDFYSKHGRATTVKAGDREVHHSPLMFEVDLLEAALPREESLERGVTNEESMSIGCEQQGSYPVLGAAHTVKVKRFSSSEHNRQLRSRMFPVWWNPTKVTLDKMMMKSAAMEQDLRTATTVTEERARFVLSPVTFPKLHWDLLSFAVIFYDAWASPFQMIFGSDVLKLSWMKAMDIIITVFFTIDIILAFNTGFVVKRGICFDRKKIWRSYVRRWFWIDLLATIPYDVLFEGGSIAGFLRFLKVFKALKTVRFIRIMRTLKSLQSTENSYFNIITQSKNLIRCTCLLIFLIMNVHIFCCLWLAMQPDLGNPQTASEAYDIYFDTYVVIFLAILNGARLNGQSGSLKLLEMLIASEQLAIVALFSAYAIFEALLLHGDAAKSQLLRERALRYMRRHQLPMKTQIEVLGALSEGYTVRALQKDFASVSNHDLHEELQRKIACELWAANFISLGLIARITEWDPDFYHSLSLICREEILATEAVVFNEFDLCIAAYYVMSGEVKVSCPLIEHTIPNFKEGSWLGESALVNPSFRRGLRAVTVSLVSLMVVPAAPFQKLLKESNLWEPFSDCLKSEVWQGLCGRCGSLGDHFFDNCPFQYVKWRPGKIGTNKQTVKPRRRGSSVWGPLGSLRGSLRGSLFSSDGLDFLEPDQSFFKDLVDFLQKHDSLHALPYLNEMEVYSLTDLEAMDISDFEAHLSGRVPPVELSEADKKVISLENIKAYRDSIHQGMDEIIETVEGHQHLMFLSHYKVEAGTEAALMRSELETLLNLMGDREAEQLDVPIFLDSEDLTDLSELQDHVKKSFNLVLLLTDGVLSRPWVLIELVVAVRSGIPVVLVQVAKPGVEFKYPSEDFYRDFLAGKTLDDSAKQLLNSCGIALATIEETLRKIFRTIACPYSPHRPVTVRNAELQRLLRNCKFRGGESVIQKEDTWRSERQSKRGKSVDYGRDSATSATL